MPIETEKPSDITRFTFSISDSIKLIELRNNWDYKEAFKNVGTNGVNKNRLWREVGVKLSLWDAQ